MQSARSYRVYPKQIINPNSAVIKHFKEDGITTLTGDWYHRPPQDYSSSLFYAEWKRSPETYHFKTSDSETFETIPLCSKEKFQKKLNEYMSETKIKQLESSWNQSPQQVIVLPGHSVKIQGSTYVNKHPEELHTYLHSDDNGNLIVTTKASVNKFLMDDPFEPTKQLPGKVSAVSLLDDHGMKMSHFEASNPLLADMIAGKYDASEYEQDDYDSSSNITDEHIQMAQLYENTSNFLHTLFENISDRFDQISKSIDAYNGDDDDIKQKTKHFKLELIKEINCLNNRLNSLYDQPNNTIRQKEVDAVYKEAEALHSYSGKLFPGIHDKSTHSNSASTTSELRDLINTDIDAINRANKSYVESQPSFTMMQKATRIGKIALALGIAALAISTGVALTVLSAGTAAGGLLLFGVAALAATSGGAFTTLSALTAPTSRRRITNGIVTAKGDTVVSTATLFTDIATKKGKHAPLADSGSENSNGQLCR